MNYQWDKEWTEWHKLLEINLSDLPESSGVYIISGKTKLNRAYGIDNEGILDIGETHNLQQRLKKFVACAKGEHQSGHIAGWRYYQFGYANIENFSLESLWLSYRKTNSKQEAYILEGSLLREYLKQHYELPPLNYKFNWSDFGYEE